MDGKVDGRKSSCLRVNSISTTIGRLIAPFEEGEDNGNRCFDNDGIEEESKEARRPRGSRRPDQPSEAERKEHELTHLPYRSWCRFCVGGRKTNRGHGVIHEHDRAVNSFHVDFCFFTNPDCEGELTDEDQESVSCQPCIVMRERETKMTFAHAVPSKGTVDNWTVEQLGKDIESMGMKGEPVILKGDQERAVTGVLNRLQKLLRDEFKQKPMQERSMAYDSRTNGIAERAIQSVESQVRVMKLFLEEKLHIKIPVRHPIFAWLVPHCADLLNKAEVGHDGRTAYERMRGKRYKGEMTNFGTKVMYRLPQKFRGGHAGARWRTGLWIGKHPKSDEHLIVDNQKLIRANAIQCLPEEEAWDASIVMTLKIVPWNLASQGTTAPECEVIPTERRAEVPTTTTYNSAVPRSIYVQRQHLDRYGYTKGCQKCESMRFGGDETVRTQHSEKCRNRVRNRMLEDPEMCEKATSREERKINFQQEKSAQGDRQRSRDDEDGVSREARGPEGGADHRGDQMGRCSKEGSRQPEEDEGTAAKMSRVESDAADQSSIIESGVESTKSFENQPGAPSSLSTPKEPYPAVSPQLAEPARLKVNPSQETQAELRERERGAEEHDSCGAGTSPRSKKQRIDLLDALKVNSMSLPRLKCTLNDVNHAKDCQNQTDVFELFTSSRLRKRTGWYNLRYGCVPDFSSRCPETGKVWDLCNKRDQDEALKMIRKIRPKFVICCPPCHLDRSKPYPEMQRDRQKIEELMNFALEVYKIQLDDGRFFVHEQQGGAFTWNLLVVKELLLKLGIDLCRLDTCCFNVYSDGDHGRGLVSSRVWLMTNSACVANAMHRRCKGGHRHTYQPNDSNGKAGVCTDSYSNALCRAISIEVSNAEPNVERDLLKVCKVEEDIYSGKYFTDDNTGKILDKEGVQKARQDEIRMYRQRGVYKKVPRAEAFRQGAARIIPVKWVDINKGTHENPKYRSRLVAKEYARGYMDDIFAATPSLESFKLLLSRLASQSRRGPGDWRLLTLDVSRAFFYAPAGRDLWVELPEEDKVPGEDYVGKLEKAMYGTRDAPAAWQEEINSKLLDLGFIQGISEPCCFHHPLRNITATIHVDDLAAIGPSAGLRWLSVSLQKHYNLDYAILGPGIGEVREVSYLNRNIRWTNEGIEYEATSKLVRKILETVGMTDCATVATPGVNAEEKGDRDDQSLLTDASKTYRQVAAMCNYLSQDRPDIGYASKCIAQDMASPTERSWAPVRRLARYLRSKPILTLKYCWQEPPTSITCYTDADWGGCKRTRASTSGGVIMMRNHVIKQWSRTQQNLALSSGEAELYAATKGGAEGLGVSNLLVDMGGERLQVRLCIDASAAVGAIVKRGSGRMKHIETQELWIQQAVHRGTLRCEKIPRDKNCADMLTHHWTRAEGTNQLAIMRAIVCEHRQLNGS